MTMMNVKARAVNGPDSEFFATEIQRRDLDKHDVLIEIKYAGICHSDIHTAREEWGPVDYPLVPGHEIAGIVKEVGPDVTKYKVGDRVGVGCMVDSCGECENCKNDEEQYCLNGNVGTYAVLTNMVRKHKAVTQHILLSKKISYYVFLTISV